MSSLKIILTLPVLAVLLLTCGCGYHSPYAVPDGKALPEAGIHLKVWENRTNELGLESTIGQALADWIIQSKHLRIKTSSSDADYELSGILLSTGDSGTSYDAHDLVQILKTVIHMSFTLKETKTGKIVWTVADLGRETSYSVGPNTVSTRSNKQKALTTLANETAEDIYLRIFYTLTKKTDNHAK